ncbi:Ribonuclease R [compost metagenome]
MRERVGETFPGVITAVTGFGIFVELTDIFVEGLVHVTALPGDYYHFDPVHHRLAGERSGRSYRLGDIVEVVVARVDLDERKIDFELASNQLSAPVGRKKRDDKAASGRPAKGRKGRVREEPAPSGWTPPEPLPAVQPRKRKVGVVQALPADVPAPAEEVLSNTDVSRSRALKQALMAEARTGTKPGGKGKGSGAPGKGKGKPAGKAAAASKPAKPGKHRKGSSKPKAETGAATGGAVRKRKAKS